MTTHDKLSAAANQAKKAIDSAKDTIASTDFDALRSKASDTASALYKGGRDALPDSDDLTRISDQIAGSTGIRWLRWASRLRRDSFWRY